MEQSVQIEEQGVGRDGLRNDSSWATRLSRVASLVLHPFFMPLYGVIALVVMDVIPALYFVKELRTRLIIATMTYTMLLPWVALVALRLFKLVDSMSVNVPRQRIIPMLILIICYISFVLVVARVQVLHLIYSFMFGATLCVMGALVITAWWKISLHEISAGGGVALALYLVLNGVSNAIFLLCGVLLCAGCLGTARLHLGSHTLAQVAVGFALGLSTVLLSLFFV